MKTINTERAKELIEETNGRIFSSTFIKKNGQHRLLTGRLKVTKGLKENAKPRPFEPSKYNLLCVYDMKINKYRMLNFNTLLTLTINKNKYKIMKLQEIKQDSKELHDYIKTYILPNESQQERIDYLKGNISYDVDYIREHMKHNTLVNCKLIE